MKVGFTGTEKGMTELQLAALRRCLIVDDLREFHHGDCIGADAQAHDLVVQIALAHDLMFERQPVIVIHPPIKAVKRAFKQPGYVHDALPYLDRDRAIVDGTDILFATPDGPEPQRKRAGGTWYTVRYARRAGKPIRIVWPDGSVTREGGR